MVSARAHSEPNVPGQEQIEKNVNTTDRKMKPKMVTGARPATDVMRMGLGAIIDDLRARMKWGQEDLAREITKRATKMDISIKPNRIVISDWERGKYAPQLRHRLVLARLAAADVRTEDLAEFFRLPLGAWRPGQYIRSRERMTS